MRLWGITRGAFLSSVPRKLGHLTGRPFDCPTWVPIAQKTIDTMHAATEIQRPDMKSDFRRRCLYLVYRSSSWEFSPGMEKRRVDRVD